jgi:hypothetical protein
LKTGTCARLGNGDKTTVRRLRIVSRMVLEFQLFPLRCQQKM